MLSCNTYNYLSKLQSERHIIMDNINWYIALVYRFLRQDSGEFQYFLFGFEKILVSNEAFKPNFLVLLGNYNARWKSCRDFDTNTSEGVQFDGLTSLHGLCQLINESVHILSSSLSCVDLIFTSQPSLFINSGTHPSLHANFHHQITYCKLNLNIKYPLPHQRLVWNFRKGDITEADSGGGARGARPAIFCNHLIFLQSLWRTTNWVIQSWTDC